MRNRLRPTRGGCDDPARDRPPPRHPVRVPLTRDTLAPLARAATGSRRTLAAVAHLRGGSEKGVYRLHFDDDTTAIAYVWSADGLIIVDGDHSAGGVAADLEWAEKIVAPGGIVVLDDFGHPKLPGIKEAFDKHTATDTRFTFLGRVAHSGCLRAEAA